MLTTLNLAPFGTNPKQILDLIPPQFEKVFKDFKLVQAPKDTQVSGHKAAYIQIR